MTDFFDTKAGKHASLAKQYLEGALTLSEAQRDRGKILFLPTLSLAGHGLELMLKACLYLNEEQPNTGGPKGHDIVGMWQLDASEPVRGHVYRNATRVAIESRDTNRYRGNIAEGDVLPLIEEYVLALGAEHGRRNYPLRYPSDQSERGPRSPFLVQSLWATADDFVKRPRDFKLAHFRGEV